MLSFGIAFAHREHSYPIGCLMDPEDNFKDKAPDSGAETPNEQIEKKRTKGFASIGMLE